MGLVGCTRAAQRTSSAHGVRCTFDKGEWVEQWQRKELQASQPSGSTGVRDSSVQRQRRELQAKSAEVAMAQIHKRRQNHGVSLTLSTSLNSYLATISHNIPEESLQTLTSEDRMIEHRIRYPFERLLLSLVLITSEVLRDLVDIVNSLTY